MVAAAYLSFTVAFLVVLLFAWRLRAESARALERAEADAKRGRHVAELAAELNNLSQALIVNLAMIPREDLDANGAETLREARICVTKLAAVLRASQNMADETYDLRGSNIEGWVRVAVAAARGEGVGILLTGPGTALTITGLTKDVLRVLEPILVGLSKTLPPGSFVEVELLPTGVEISAAIAPGRTIDPNIVRATAIAGLIGLTADISATSTVVTVRLGGELQTDDPEAQLLGKSPGLYDDDYDAADDDDEDLDDVPDELDA